LKQYLLSIYQPAEGAPPPEVLAGIMRDIAVLIEDAKSAGAWVFNGGLEPPRAARVIRAQTTDTVVTDGPYIETKEFVGGFLIVKTATPEAAMEWARRLAAILRPLAIEVRAFHDS
jgi:hypothetical protein